MTLLNDLPEEVLHRVLSSVSPSHSQELALLSQLAGLSKRFSIVCRLLLYRIIASSGGQHAHLADVAKSPKLRKMVKQLSVALPFATDQSFVKQDNPQTKLVPYQVNSLSAASIASMHHLINLERLEIFFPQDQGRKPSITTEAWPTIDFIITPDVDSLLSLPFLSNLTYLSLSSPSNIVVHYAQLRALLKLTPRLETLSLAGPDPEHLLTVPMQSNIDLRRLIWRQARFTGEFEDASPLFGGSNFLLEITAIEFHDTDFTAADMRDVGLPQLCNIISLVQSHMRQHQNLDDIANIFPNIQQLSITDAIVSPDPRHSLSQILLCKNAVFLELRTLSLSFVLGGESTEALDNFLNSLPRLLQSYHFPVLQACAIEMDFAASTITALQWQRMVHSLAVLVNGSSAEWLQEYRMVCKNRYVRMTRERDDGCWSDQGTCFNI